MTHRENLIIIGGIFLAFGASFCNTALILHTGSSVSHLTGDISRISIDSARFGFSHNADLSKVLTATIGFLLGSTTSGFILHHPHLDFHRPYGRCISAIGLAFLMANFLHYFSDFWMILLAAFGCGFQNSLATRYRGMIIRTTHLTGLVTDLGTMLGMKFKGHDLPTWKIVVPFILTVSFLLGAAVSSILLIRYHLNCLLIIALCYIICGMFFSYIKRATNLFIDHSDPPQPPTDHSPL